LLKYAIYPYTWLVVLLGMLTVAVFRHVSLRRQLWIRTLAVAALLAGYLMGTPFVARFFAASLEEQYAPMGNMPVRRFDAIVVLGGGVYPKGTLRPANTLTGYSIERTLCGADLFARGLAPSILFSGGDASIFEEGPVEAVEMKRLAMRLGVLEDAILLETQSRTTYEGAVAVKAMLGGKSVLLVTSASHIPRALGLFRKQGVDATPYPCGYISRHRSGTANLSVLDFFPQVEALKINTQMISEMVGILVYRTLGKL
jgi:uncharacterized SAM-binding protein YcdF (DUF218 family)